MSLTVKAYLERDGGETEIRRFPIDPGASTNFTYFASKIPQVVSTLAGKSFDMYWKDTDGDLVAFSSDEELTEALGFVNDGIFRVYIREKKSKPAPCNEGQVHMGVVCDICESRICGSRFKCMECPDYDLCSTCENKGEHADHRMIRIRNPGIPPFVGWDGPFAGGFPDPNQHPPHGPPPMGPFGPMGPGCGRGGFGGRMGWPWRKMMKRCWKQWMRNMWQGQEPAMFCANESEEDVKQCKEPRKDESNNVRTERENMQKDENEKKDTAEGGQEGPSQHDDYLRSVGESVAAMLDPLGISVDVDVEHQGKRKRCHGGRGGGWGRGRCRRGWGGWGPWMWGMGRGGMGNPWEQWQQPTERREPQPGTSQQGEKQSEDAAPSEKQAEASAPSPADVHMNSPFHQSESDGDWMMLNKDKPSSDMEANPSSPRTQDSQDPPFQIYPSLEPQHPDPKINEALKQLLAMGFTNDGGWLVSLLEAKGGDINKTLDALKPHRPQ